MAAVVEKILNEEPIPPGKIRPEIPAGLNRLIMQMLSKEAEARPTAEHVLQVLQSVEKDVFIPPDSK